MIFAAKGGEMEFFNSAVGVALTVGLILVVIALLFRKSIVRRIEEGSPFTTEISATSAKLILGNREEGIPPAGAEAQEAKSLPPEDQPGEPVSRPLPVDPKLVHIIPPVDPEQFRTLPFPILDTPQSYLFPFAPSGLALFNGVPFFLRPTGDKEGRLIGHQVLNVQPDAHNHMAITELSAVVEGVSAVHLLISAGHGRISHEGVQFLHKRIGYIELIFNDEPTQRVSLVLGRNIREWAFGNPFDLVRTVDDSSVHPAWVSHNSYCRIDQLTIAIQDAPRDLKAIHLAAKFEDDQPGREFMFPAVILSAATAERSTTRSHR
jgi:hypothetical protein